MSDPTRLRRRVETVFSLPSLRVAPARPRVATPASRRPPLTLVLPSLAVGLLAVIPLVYLVVRAAGAPAGVDALLLRPRTIEILATTVLLGIAVAILSTAIGLPLAWLTTRTDLPGRRAWTVLAASPLAIPSYVTAFGFVAAFGPSGLLRTALAPLGVGELPSVYGLPGTSLVLGLAAYPYVFLAARAAFLRTDPGLEEAARSLGDRPRSVFWRVTLPAIAPGLAAGVMLAVLYAISDFGAVALLGLDTLARAIYTQYRAAFDRSLAAALSLVLVLVALAILLAESRLRGEARFYRVGPGAARPAAPVRLGRWRWPATVLCGLLLAGAVALPVALLGISAARALGEGTPLDPVVRATLHSVSLAGLAALATAAVALPLAVLSVRYPGRLATLVERLAYVGFALPRISIALGLVFFGAQYARFLYQTTALVVVAYVILFLPTMLGATTSSLRQVTPQIEDAARSLGYGPRRVFTAVTLPLVSPGVLAGAALVFLLAMEELPATLILRPAGLDTLATLTWSAASQAFFGQAALSALLLVVAASLSLAILYHRDEGFTG